MAGIIANVYPNALVAPLCPFYSYALGVQVRATEYEFQTSSLPTTGKKSTPSLRFDRCLFAPSRRPRRLRLLQSQSHQPQRPRRSFFWRTLPAPQTSKAVDLVLAQGQRGDAISVFLKHGWPKLPSAATWAALAARGRGLLRYRFLPNQKLTNLPLLHCPRSRIGGCPRQVLELRRQFPTGLQP
jgi:hypothetical protein